MQDNKENNNNNNMVGDNPSLYCQDSIRSALMVLSDTMLPPPMMNMPTPYNFIKGVT